MKRCFVFSHQEAIETFKEALKLKSDFIDAYKSLGQAYRYSSPVVLFTWAELTVYISVDENNMSLLFMELRVLPLPCFGNKIPTVALLPSIVPPFRELGDFESAMESFQKALMLNQNHIQSLQLRGMMLYHHGSLQEAIGNFKVQESMTHPLLSSSEITFKQ